MRSVNEGDPRWMDKFADALEKAIVVLKDNSLHAEMKRNGLNRKGKNETMETLNEWVAVEGDCKLKRRR